jgi:DNA-binding LacI/PurR family transcriptional regulator
MLSTYKVPHVQINPYTLDDSIPSVAGDDTQGARLMTDYLISLGHRQISFLTGPRNMRASQDRLQGYRSALQEAGIPFEERWVRSSEWTFDGGYTLTRIMMQEPQAPTAIFAGNDEAAYGALYAAQEMGLRVPGRLSIAGYDDLAFSKNIWPGLTTIHQPSEEVVERATRLLIDILKGVTPQPPVVRVPSRLVVRGSTGVVNS